jgi:tetratricopeptide (TPR) repeat protein
MKANLFVLGLVAAGLAALFQIHRLFEPSGAGPASALPAPPDAGGLAVPDPEPEGTALYASLPLDRPSAFDAVMSEDLRGRLTSREQRDQLLDWMLFAVVSDSGLSADHFNRVLFDVPTVRHGYMRAVADFDYGPTRACHIGEGRVLALLPRCGAAERKDYLAHVADEYRKTLGEKPARLLVFEYELRPEAMRGSLTRRADIDGAELFAEAYGYKEEAVGDREAFERFLAAVPDVTHAALTEGRLTLGGRRLLGRQYRGLRAEDVAALWQAQDKLNRQPTKEAILARLKEELDAAERRWKGEREEVFRRWQVKLDELKAAQKKPPGDGPDKGNEYKAKAAELQAGYDREIKALIADQERAAKALVERQQTEWRKRPPVDHTGFSLDPEYDFERLRRWFQDDAEKRLREIAAEKGAPLSTAEVEKVGEGLKNDDVVPLLVLLDKLRRSDAFLAKLTAEYLEGEQEKHRVQRARYDGDLQGTEVGMVLFYTDLLAKLWTLDYLDSLPRREIEDFRSDVDGGNPPLYKEETLKYPGTRIWFGPEDRAFQLVQDRGALLFARRATRIFSASSNPLQPGKEAPTNYAAAKVMDWWNDHYEEVAHYEPEYERLNEYIKWSVVISWLDARRSLDQLAFLKDIAVDRSAWFPDWAAKHPELRYQKWRQVGFLDRGLKGASTEALPILKSRIFRDYGESEKNWGVSGGVSGATPKDLEARPVLPALRGSPLQLSARGLDLRSLPDGSDRSLRALGGGIYRFEETSRHEASLTVTPPKERALRGPHGDLAGTTFIRSVTCSEGMLRVSTRTESAPLCELRISSGRDGFRVRYRSGDVDAGQSLARDLSRSKDPRAMLAADARVKAVVDLGEGQFLVRQHGCEKWLKISPENTSREDRFEFVERLTDDTVVIKRNGRREVVRIPSPPRDMSVCGHALGCFADLVMQSAGAPGLRKSWDARVADVVAGTRPYQLSWVEATDVLAEIGGGKYLRLDLQPLFAPHPGLPILTRPSSDRELPDEAKTVVLKCGGEQLPGFIDRDARSLYLVSLSLPKELLTSPEGLTRLVRSIDPQALRAAAANQRGAAHVSAGVQTVELPALLAHLEGGRAREAARLIAVDPRAARRALDAALAQRQEEVDGYLDQGRPGEAKELLEKALRIYPDHPNLLTRLGLAEAELGRPDAAAECLNKSVERARRPERLLDEVNRRLQGKPTGPAREQALRQARLAAARDLTARKRSAAEAKAVVGKEGAEIEVRLSGDLKGEAARPADLHADSTLYLDDSAGLENRDWTPSGRRKSLEQALEGGELELVAVHEPDPVFQTKPDLIRVGDSETAPRFRLASLAKYGAALLARVHYRSKKDDEYCEEEADEGKGDKPEIDCKDRAVYLLRKKGKS